MSISPDDEDRQLRTVALKNASSILLARQRAEEELLRTREALRQSQERLTAALAASGTCTFRWTMATDTVEWDGDLDRLFGAGARDRVGTLDAFLAAVHDDDRPGVAAACARCAAGGPPIDVEFRVVHPDGHICWVQAGATLFAPADGPTSMTGACTDVSSRRRAAEALRENEERLRAIFNQAAVGIAVAGLDGRLNDMNRRFAEIVGYTEDELRGTWFNDFTHPDDRARTLAAVRRLLEGEIADFAMEKRYQRRDGTTVWSLTSVTLVKDSAGRPQRFIAIIEDITLRKEAEAALREETRMLELLNRTGTSLASQLDLQAVVQAVTDAATQLSGARFGAFFYNVTDEEGDAFRLLTLSGAAREEFEQFGHPRATPLFAPTFRGEPPTRVDDVLADPRYGTMPPHFGMPKGHVPVRSYLAVPVKGRSGEVIGGLFFGHPEPNVFSARSERLIVGVAAQAAVAIENARLYEASQRAAEERERLLDSERAARAAAERISEVKDEFLATLSHELRTPLNAILGWAHILRSRRHDSADYTRGLETIERNARVQTQLIEDLLDMSRIAAGKLRLDVQLLQPATCVESAVETVRPAAEAKSIRVETFLDPDAGPISGDPGRLQQVAWNLLSNAIKFTPRDGSVRVVLERVGSHVEITVADTGVGIPREFVPHLFERFRQADASTTRKYGGLGLGLSIVKSLVELHGGTIAVESPGEGQGTRVMVQLPLAEGHRSSPARRPPRGAVVPADDGEGRELAGLNVLVVDDQPDAREVIARVLEESAAEVIAVGTVDEAVALVEARRPDVLISDLGMPDSDGFHLLRRVRALGADRGGGLPAIAVTAFARADDRTRALRAGFAVHVPKPVDPAELVASVASVTGRLR